MRVNQSLKDMNYSAFIILLSDHILPLFDRLSLYPLSFYCLLFQYIYIYINPNQGRATNKGQWVTQFMLDTRWSESVDWIPYCGADGQVGVEYKLGHCWRRKDGCYYF